MLRATEHGVIICHRNRLIFFHNPKCAGSSFREALRGYHDDPFIFYGIHHAPYFKNALDHGHLRLWELHALFPRVFECATAYDSVIFVRNPQARFLSALNEHMKKFQPQINLAAMAPAQRAKVIEDFITRVLNVGRITTNWRFVHFSPQVWFLKLGESIVPKHIIPMDASGSFARAGLAALGLPEHPMPLINPSTVDLSAALRFPTVARFVADFYADDFAFFRAHPSLSGLLDAPPTPQD
jgi:Sulfotransferase family